MNHSRYSPDIHVAPPTWHQEAACLGRADEMFPDNHEAGITQAKRICSPCPVWRECLEDALRRGDNQHGIRGGLKPEERRKLAKERANPGSTVTTLAKPKRPSLPPPKTLAEAFARRTGRADDGHVLFHGGQYMKFQGAKYTALQAAFIVGHGREPEGPVRRTCGAECFRADHLTDGVIRDSEALCGTRAGYRRHKKHGEVACTPCRKANADADRLLRNTGATKVAV